MSKESFEANVKLVRQIIARVEQLDAAGMQMLMSQMESYAAELEVGAEITGTSTGV